MVRLPDWMILYMFMMRHDINDLHFSGRFDLPEYDRRLLMMHPAILLTLFKRVKRIFYICVVAYCSYKYVFNIYGLRKSTSHNIYGLRKSTSHTTFRGATTVFTANH